MPLLAAADIDAHRIAPKLWVGSTPGPEHGALFDVIVLCAVEYQPSLPNVRVIHAGFDDTLEPTRAELRIARDAAAMVNMHRSAGRRVLVSCMQGRNRSALVAALALVLQGTPPTMAITQVRRYRKHPEGKLVLSNPAFMSFLLSMK
jgi:protein-tyrosine phosphatase